MMESQYSDSQRRERILSMMEYIDNLFQQEHIWYSLAYGTLLGAVREKGFIPWDVDADIYVRYCDIDRIRTLITGDPNCPYHLCVPGREKRMRCCHDRLTIPGVSHFDCHLDICVLIGLPKEEKFARKYTLFGYRLYTFLSAKYKPLNKTRHKYLLVFIRALSYLIPDSIANVIFERVSSKYAIEESKYTTMMGAVYGDYYEVADLMDTIRMQFEDKQFSCIIQYDKYLSSIYGDYMTPRQKNYVKKSIK